MQNKTRLILYGITGGFFLFLDQILKYFAKANSEFSFYIWKNWLGWEYFENLGVAFSLPLPAWLMIVLTPLILVGLLVWLGKKKNKTNYFYLGIILIFSGAVSNFIDRILFGFTIDYIRILTGVINLADVLIVVGAGVMLINNYLGDKKKLSG